MARGAGNATLVDSTTAEGRDPLYGSLTKVVLFAVTLVALAWFLSAAMLVVLVIFASIVVAIVLNVPVTWLEDRGLPRVVGSLLVLGTLLVLSVGVVLLVGPRLLEQSAALVESVPQYVADLEDASDRVLGRHPALDSALRVDSLEDAAPSLASLAGKVGRYTVGVLALVVFTVTGVAMVIYMLVSPRPLLQGLLRATPPRHRERMARSFSRASTMVVGWLWANVVVGLIEAVLVAIFLTWIGVPGALVWATLAFFAELVPKVGPYLMAAPPLVVALATDPRDALWVLIFYIVMNEVMGDVVAPYVRGETMKIHPVYLIMAVLVFGSTLGLVGALLATPLAAFAAAFWQEFYLSRHPEDGGITDAAESMLRRTAHASG